MASGAGDDDGLPPQIRLMNFVSEDQLEEARKTRGARVEDGTAQRDWSLYEILKENKDKKDAEFTERFKHKPPKALDEDESEFLDTVHTSRREYEQKMADEEAQELRAFQAAVVAQEPTLPEPKNIPPVPKNQDLKMLSKKNPQNPLGMVIKVLHQAKKVKTVSNKPGESPTAAAIRDDRHLSKDYTASSNFGKSGSLVSYSDESDEDS